MADRNWDKRIAQERALIEAAEVIARALKQENVKRSELAKRMGLTKAAITQILSGERNLTVKTLSDALFELGYRVTFGRCSLDSQPHRRLVLRPVEGAWPEVADYWPDEPHKPVASVRLAG